MPSAPTNDVDLYATHSDLVDELGGSARKLRGLLPPDETAATIETGEATELVRTQALRDVLKSLARRTPPILESQLSDPTQIKDAVVYGSLMRLYRAAMTTPDDVNATLCREFKKRYEEEMGNLRLSINNASAVDVGPTTIFRR